MILVLAAVCGMGDAQLWRRLPPTQHSAGPAPVAGRPGGRKVRSKETSMVSAAEEAGVQWYTEPADVHLDDLDFMGNLHNGRYPLLVERALVRIWGRAGYALVNGVPTH